MSGINYTPPKTVRNFMLSDAEFRAIMGPIGSGKSAGCVIEVLRRCIAQPKSPDGFRRSRWAIIRNTRPQLKDTTLQTWLQWVPSGVLGRWKESEMIFYLEFNDVKAEILFRPLDTPDDVQRVLSLELTGAWFNEAREIPIELLQAVQGRLGRYPRRADVDKYWIGTIADTNPPEEGSPWYNIIEHLPQEENNPNSVMICDSFKQPSGLSIDAENVPNLRENYYDNLAKGKTSDWIDVYIHGMYAKSQSGKPVYLKQFKSERHVSKSPISIHPKAPVIIGHDFGRTPAAAFMQQQVDGRIKVIREIVGFDIGLRSFTQRYTIPLLRSTFPDNPIIFVGDPSGANQNQSDDNSCIKELKAIFKEDGYYIKTARTNDPIQRINALSEVLSQYPDGEPLFEVDPSCKWIIEGIRSKYRFAKKQGTSGSFHDRPDKNEWSHIIEALQYGVLFITGKYYPEDYAVKRRPMNIILPRRTGDVYAGY